ncbi:MAG: transcription termination factor NusA [Mycoplasmataceae bacterium]|nr:transcription termination factor NusA [Mycoplasmataceae bacterium]
MKNHTPKQVDWNKQMADTINALTLIADENNIPRDTVAEALKDAIIKSYTKEYPETIVEVDIDIDNKRLSIHQLFKVVEPNDELNDYAEITITEAQKVDPKLQVGDFYKKVIPLQELSKLSLGMHLAQMFKHNVTNQSNKQVFTQWKPRIGEVVYAEVEKVDAKSGVATVNLESTFGFVGRQETIPGEILIPGQKYNFYIKDVKEQTKGWPIILSRADSGLVKYLLTLNIPEIQEKIIEIKDIARVAGFKTKLSVMSHQVSVEPAGTIIGPRGSRIKNIQEQIHNEHIEVIEYVDDFKQYIVNVCSPAEILGFAIKEPTTPEERREITLVARSDKLALLIGKRGTNVRLISEMLKANIEINTVEEAHEANLQYQRVDPKTLRQQTFNRAYKKYHVGGDVLSQYNRATPHSGKGTDVPPKSSVQQHVNAVKKSKDSIMQDFKDINKEDLLKELMDADTTKTISDNIDESNNEDY